MNYLKYIKNKLSISADENIIEKAVEYIGDDYPRKNHSKKGYEIVDEWIYKILDKWSIQVNTVDYTKSTFLGKLIPRQGGFTINLNKNLYPTKKRFTLVHEIAHLLSYDTTKSWPVYSVYHSRLEELLCDKIARAILLPSSLIDFENFNLLEINDSQVNKIKSLWPEYKISPWQIIQRFNEELNQELLVGVYWKYFEDENCLKIIDHFQPKNIFIPKNKRVFVNNLFRKTRTNLSPEIAFNSRKLFNGEDVIELGSLYKKNLFSTVFPLETNNSSLKYVIQLIKM